MYDSEGKFIVYADWYTMTNLQADVIAITDRSGIVVARYSYDAWAHVRLIRTARTVLKALTRIGIGVLQQLRRILQRSEKLYAQRKIRSIIGLL